MILQRAVVDVNALKLKTLVWPPFSPYSHTFLTICQCELITFENESITEWPLSLQSNSLILFPSCLGSLFKCAATVMVFELAISEELVK